MQLPLCFAADEPESKVSLSGFGTAGLVHSSEDQADFGAGPFKPHGAGHTRSWSPEVDSRLGLQLTANATDELSATVQVVAEQRQEGNFRPHVEWANIKYQITPQLSLRIGRTAIASFMVADSRKVGYINPWVRPPEDVYGLLPIFSSDGVDASYRLHSGEFTHTVMAGFGRTDAKASDGTVARGRDNWTVSDTMEYGHLALRVAYQSGKLSIQSLNGLFDGLRQFGADGVALADRYDPNRTKVVFVAVGGTYDPGAWFITSEWGNSNLHSVLGTRTAWYATTGYRFGTLTPYATYADVRARSNTSDPGLDLSTVPPGTESTAAALNAVLNRVLGAIPQQHTVSAGIRWDLVANIAVKLQYDHMDLDAGSPGVLVNVQPGFRPGGTVHLVSATVDFVW